MKGLIITDVHEYTDVAQSLATVKKPDFVLDCGDHHSLDNLFELTPHFYVHGNHEPQVITSSIDGMPIPHAIHPGQIIHIRGQKNELLRVAGIGGNYSGKNAEWSVDDYAVRQLSKIRPSEVDVFLVHESPLDVRRNIYDSSLAPKVLEEIDRIKPHYVFAGHVGEHNQRETPGGVDIIRLPDVQLGHGILTVSDKESRFEYIREVYGRPGPRK